MHISRSRDENNTRYQLFDKDIRKVNHEKDIGVILDEDLSFDKHI